MERHDLPQPEEPRATLRPDQDGVWTRRRMIARAAAIGAGSAVFGRAVAALAAGGPVTAAMIREAEWVSGLDLPEDQRAMMIEGVNGLLADFEKLRAVPLDNAVPPAWRFATTAADDERAARRDTTVEFKPDRHPQHPASDDDLAFAPLSTLAALLRARKVSSVELTKLYLARLRRFDPLLECVITLTEELALEQAERADREIGAGSGAARCTAMPWGAKDLLAVPGYPTTWGAKPYQDQVRAEKATVARRLEEAGAVLVAKLALGALAMGDVWFGGQTRNPWNPAEGSSGSSAGPASATAAGLVGFAVGSETLGSIVSPCTRCGATGLRPTFGRVCRHGAMALSWTMDKLGPLARSAEDCALVFAAIHGADGVDPTAVDRPFRWPLERDPRALRVGYVEAAFEEDRTQGVEKEEDRARLREWQAFDRRTLATLRDLGFKPAPVKLPADLPLDSLRFILQAEAATAFDELTRSGRAALLKRQDRQRVAEPLSPRRS